MATEYAKRLKKERALRSTYDALNLKGHGLSQGERVVGIKTKEVNGIPVTVVKTQDPDSHNRTVGNLSSGKARGLAHHLVYVNGEFLGGAGNSYKAGFALAEVRTKDFASKEPASGGGDAMSPSEGAGLSPNESSADTPEMRLGRLKDDEDRGEIPTDSNPSPMPADDDTAPSGGAGVDRYAGCKAVWRRRVRRALRRAPPAASQRTPG